MHQRGAGERRGGQPVRGNGVQRPDHGQPDRTLLELPGSLTELLAGRAGCHQDQFGVRVVDESAELAGAVYPRQPTEVTGQLTVRVALCGAGADDLDLTVSLPTRCGLGDPDAVTEYDGPDGTRHSQRAKDEDGHGRHEDHQSGDCDRAARSAEHGHGEAGRGDWRREGGRQATPHRSSGSVQGRAGTERRRRPDGQDAEGEGCRHLRGEADDQCGDRRRRQVGGPGRPGDLRGKSEGAPNGLDDDLGHGGRGIAGANCRCGRARILGRRPGGWHLRRRLRNPGHLRRCATGQHRTVEG